MVAARAAGIAMVTRGRTKNGALLRSSSLVPSKPTRRCVSLITGIHTSSPPNNIDPGSRRSGTVKPPSEVMPVKYCVAQASGRSESTGSTPVTTVCAAAVAAAPISPNPTSAVLNVRPCCIDVPLAARRERVAHRDFILDLDSTEAGRYGLDAEVSLPDDQVAGRGQPAGGDIDIDRARDRPRDAVERQVARDAETHVAGAAVLDGDLTRAKDNRRVFRNVEHLLTQHRLLHLGYVVGWLTLCPDLEGRRVEGQLDRRLLDPLRLHADLAGYGRCDDFVIVSSSAEQTAPANVNHHFAGRGLDRPHVLIGISRVRNCTGTKDEHRVLCAAEQTRFHVQTHTRLRNHEECHSDVARRAAYPETIVGSEPR